MEQPYMDRSGVVHFPGESDDSARMGDSLVRDRDSSELELEQERDLRELEESAEAVRLLRAFLDTIAARGYCAAADDAMAIYWDERQRERGRTA
jgi:hypothetical protein